MKTDRMIKVWNKTVIIKDVPEQYTDEELVNWTKKKLMMLGMVKKGGKAS